MDIDGRHLFDPFLMSFVNVSERCEQRGQRCNLSMPTDVLDIVSQH